MITHSHLIATTSSKLNARVVLTLIFHHVELMIIIGTTIHLLMVLGSTENGSIKLVTTWDTVFSIVSASIGCIISIDIMWIIIILLTKVTTDYIF